MLEYLYLVTNMQDFFLWFANNQYFSHEESTFKLLRTVSRAIPPAIDSIGLLSLYPFEQFTQFC